MKVFGGLKYRQLTALIEIINITNDKNIDVIKRRHRDLSDNFEGAMAFLRELRVLDERNSKLSIIKEFKTSNKEQPKALDLERKLLNRLLSTDSAHFNDVHNYLKKYKVINNNYEYRPTTSSRVKESAVRDLLIEFNFIEYNKTLYTYRIKEDHLDSFEVYLKLKKLSPSDLAYILKRKEDIGKAAELVVMQFERERLKGNPSLLKLIEHVALKDVMAGYDILSWELGMNKRNSKPRYIEVKAVSKLDSGFCWSRNEIKKASVLADRYYLYLLPVIGNFKFDLKALIIIPNPFTNVYNDIEGWNRQIESYLFYKETI